VEVVHFICIVALSYLAGAFPTSIVIGKLFFHKDIRNYGSKNAGGTNAVRVFGWKAGSAVMAVDVAKGVCVVLCIARLPLFNGMEEPLLPVDLVTLTAGCTAVIGHIWTVFASFKGGKGVATAAGMFAALYPPAFFITLVFFAAAVLITGIVSVGSLTAALVFPATQFILNATGVTHQSSLLLWVTIPVALLIIFTHRENIKRLIRAEGPRMFGKKSTNPPRAAGYVGYVRNWIVGGI